MLLRAEDIPAELVPCITKFVLPSGASISFRIASHHDHEGWAIAVESYRYIYADGVVAEPPRSRAYAELGFPGGDDDLQTEADWEAVKTREAELTPQMIMPLAQAWDVAQRHGAANRHARVGEHVTVDGCRGVVEDAGHPGDNPRHVFLQFPEEAGRKSASYPLWKLRYVD